MGRSAGPGVARSVADDVRGELKSARCMSHLAHPSQKQAKAGALRVLTAPAKIKGWATRPASNRRSAQPRADWVDGPAKKLKVRHELTQRRADRDASTALSMTHR